MGSITFAGAVLAEYADRGRTTSAGASRSSSKTHANRSTLGIR
jgi:short subunit dehydrogenase-like uncharacterized protein